MPPMDQGSRWDRVGAATERLVPQGTARFFTKRLFIMLAVVAAVLVLVFGTIIFSGLKKMKDMASQEQATAVATVQAQSLVWQTQLRAVGTMHAVSGADLASESSGLVTRIGFKAGEDVKKGVLLIQLRDDAERATYDDALLTYQRYSKLIKTKAISQADYDSAEAAMRSARAALEKKAIRAPYDGRVGIRQVDVGQYVAAGTTLVTLQQLDPIYVDFKVPQQSFPLLHVGSNVTLTTDVVPGKSFVGEISAFDPKIDETTRTVSVRAVIRNPGKVLLPGMFATVIVTAGQSQRILTLPQTAITYNTYGNSVFLVKKEIVDGKERLVAEQRFVTTGDTRGDQVAILGGITPTDTVVSAGNNKLKNGVIVTVDNTIKLPNDSNPHPAEE